MTCEIHKQNFHIIPPDGDIIDVLLEWQIIQRQIIALFLHKSGNRKYRKWLKPDKFTKLSFYLERGMSNGRK